MTDTEQKQAALEDVQAAQTAFWEALGQLEALLDISIDDSTVDFEGHTVETLLEQYADDAEVSA